MSCSELGSSRSVKGVEEAVMERWRTGLVEPHQTGLMNQLVGGSWGMRIDQEDSPRLLTAFEGARPGARSSRPC